jgi:hypothetical protein
VIILAILGINLVWEIIRANIGQPATHSWPMRFMLLDLSTTATLLGAAGGLFLARLQWAKANRPSMSYAIVDDGRFSKDSEKWTVWIHNSGPGIAVVETYSYVVKFTNQPKSVPITLDEINGALEARGLVDGVDYFVREQGAGTAYAPVHNQSEGTMICWFTIRALAELEVFDFVLRVKDGMGDKHQRTLTICKRMPSVAVKARQRFLQKTLPRI